MSSTFYATSKTPAIVGICMDDSFSMTGKVKNGNSKAKEGSTSIQDLVVQMQAGNLTSRGFRYCLSIVSFGSKAKPIAEAQAPGEIDLEKVNFKGLSGNTNMPDAIRLVTKAVRRSIERCRALPNFTEAQTAPPLVLFFSDGANTAGPVDDAASELHSLSLLSGPITVVAVGIGMEPGDFPVMQKIASRPDLAINLSPEELSKFIAQAAQTLTQPMNDPGKVLVEQTTGQPA